MPDAKTGNVGAEKQSGSKGTPRGTRKGKASNAKLASPFSQAHENLKQAIGALNDATSGEDRSSAADKVTQLWCRHARMEEGVLGSLRENESAAEMVRSADVGHDIVRLLLSNLRKRDPGDPYFAAIGKELGEVMKRVIAMEGRQKSGLAAQAKSAGIEIKEDATEHDGDELDLDLRVLGTSQGGGTSGNQRDKQQEEYTAMASNRMRDERGRFTDDDDEDDRRRSSYSRRSDDDDDERRYSSRSRGQQSDREGSGWYGDSRGHSEAAHRGWDTRRGDDRSREDDDDRYARSSSSRSRQRYEDDDDERGSRGREHGGWFGDSEGHSRAARGQSSGGGRREYDDDYDRRRSQSSRRDDDDDVDRRGSGRGYGGWFGDSGGHSQASRRGWDERRDDDDDRRYSSRGRR